MLIALTIFLFYCVNLYAVANNENFTNLLCKKTDANVKFKKYKSHEVNFDVQSAKFINRLTLC